MAYYVEPTFYLEIDGEEESCTIAKMETDEQLFGSTITVYLDNSGGTHDADDWVGKTFELTITPPAGGHTLPKGWVWSQEWVSMGGKEYYRIVACDGWALLAKCVPTMQVQYWNNAGMKDASGTVKARYTDYYNKDIRDIVQAITSEAVDITTTWDVGDATGLKPSITIHNALTGIRDLMEMTSAFLIWNGTNFVYTEPQTAVADHNFTSSDSVWVSIDTESLVLPNRIVVQSVDIALEEAGLVDPVIYEGNHVNSKSYTNLGSLYIDRYYQDYSQTLANDAACSSMAEVIMSKLEAGAVRGTVYLLNQHEVDLLDCVQCTDVRGNTIEKGTVYAIKRRYDRGEYSLEINIGGVAGSAVPETNPAPSDLVSPTSHTHLHTQMFNFQPAYLPITIDIDFTITDDDDFTWTAGKIYTADGSSWTVDAGSKNLETTNLYYGYYDTNLVSGDDNYHKLIWTTTFTDTTPHGKLLVCFAKQAADGENDCMVVAAEGGNSSVFSYVTKLSAIAADIGLITAGELRVGTGGYSNFTGFRMWVVNEDETNVGCIAGYNGGDLGTPGDGVQWYSDTDGVLYCGDGAVYLNSTGLHIKGSVFYIRDDDGNLIGNLYGGTNSMYLSDSYTAVKFTDSEFEIDSDNNILIDSEDYISLVSSDDIYIMASSTEQINFSCEDAIFGCEDDFIVECDDDFSVTAGGSVPW
jgi:hypothetical protein